MNITFTYLIDTKKVLNSNVRLHQMAHAKKVLELRTMSAAQGLQWRRDNGASYELALARFEYLGKCKDEKLLARKYKRLADYDQFGDEPSVPYLFDYFTARLTVCPPTRAQIDPPNLYPTLKPIIDGLTDASFWEDDNYKHMLETSFRYGGLSDVKKHYRLILELREQTDLSNFITEV